MSDDLQTKNESLPSKERPLLRQARSLMEDLDRSLERRWYTLGMVVTEQEKYQAALKAYPDSLKRSPSMNYPKLLNNLNERLEVDQNSLREIVKDRNLLSKQFALIAKDIFDGRKDLNSILVKQTGRTLTEWKNKSVEATRSAFKEELRLTLFLDSRASCDDLESNLMFVPFEKMIGAGAKLLATPASILAAKTSAAAEKFVIAGAEVVSKSKFAKEVMPVIERNLVEAKLLGERFKAQSAHWMNETWEAISNPMPSQLEVAGEARIQLSIAESRSLQNDRTIGILKRGVGGRTELESGLTLAPAGTNLTPKGLLDSLGQIEHVKPLKEFEMLLDSLNLKFTGRRAVGGESIILEIEGNRVIKLSQAVEGAEHLGKRAFDLPYFEKKVVDVGLKDRPKILVEYVTQPVAAMDVTPQQLKAFSKLLKDQGYEWIDTASTFQVGRHNGDVKLLDYRAVQKVGEGLKERIISARELLSEIRLAARREPVEALTKIIKNKPVNIDLAEFYLKRVFESTFGEVGKKEFFEHALPIFRSRYSNSPLNIYREAMALMSRAENLKVKQVADFFKDFK